MRGIAPEGSPDILVNGAMRVRDCAIVEIGLAEALIREHPAEEVVGTDADVVLPGFVNAASCPRRSNCGCPNSWA